MTEKYRRKEKTVFVCRECNREWDVPGAAESCYNRHKLMEVLEDVQNHKKLFIEDVIEDIEQKVTQGDYDYE